MAIRGGDIAKVTIDFSDGRYVEIDGTNIVGASMGERVWGGGFVELELSFEGVVWAMRDPLPMPQQVLQSGKEVIYLTDGE